MIRPLAVFTPILGRWGHAFVAAHIERILPERTVVLAVCAFEPSPLCWDVRAPQLYIHPRIRPTDFSIEPRQTMFGALPAHHRDLFSSPEHARKVKRFLVEHGVEVVLAQWLDVSQPLVSLTRDLGIRYFCQTHGSDISAGMRSSAVREAYEGYNRTDGVIAPSEFGRQQLISLGLQPDNVHVIRHGVTVPVQAAGRSEEPVRCLAVGRFDPMKAPLTILAAFRRALESCPDLHLDYVGDGLMGPAVRQFIADSALQDRVTLHGFLRNEEVLQLMLRSHILMHPSELAEEFRYDTCPVVVAEAMACGMAIVATRHGGIPEEVVDGESGILVDEGDREAVAQGVVTLARDGDLRHRLGEAARVRAREVFSTEVVRRDMLELLGIA